MSEFINTIEALGDKVVSDSIIKRTITEFKDDQLTKIGAAAFVGCTALTTVDLPNVTTIEHYTFQRCSLLSTLRIPKVTSISNDAFMHCTSLTTVDLPSCTSLANLAFQYCSKLETLILRSETMCSIFAYTLADTKIASGSGYVYVPRALVETYKADSVWSKYANQFRALEEYTVDGTITGELDRSKI